MKKILYIFFLTTLLFSACEEEEFPQKYASFFPYEEDTWQERQFQTPHGVETMHLRSSFDKYDDKHCGIHTYNVDFSIVGNYKQDDRLLNIKSFVGIEFNNGSKLWTGEVSYSAFYGPFNSDWANIKKDTLYFTERWMTFIRNKGLTKIKWPKKEKVTNSKFIEIYPNAPWGETWTLIE